MEEIWKEIDGFDGKYQVSNAGLVKACRSVSPHDHYHYPRLMKGYTSSEGYPSVGLSNGIKRKSFSVHRLVAQAFIPNPENKKCVNHKNSIRHDNRVENLEWCTHSENALHGFSSGFRVSPFEYLSKNGLVTKRYKAVINLDTGIFYDSVSEAARSHNINKKTLNTWLRGTYPNKTSIIYC